MIPPSLGAVLSESSFGVIISDERLKYALLKPRKGTSDVISVGLIPIEGYSGEQISNELKKIRASIKALPSKAVLYIPSRYLITKTIEIPSIDKAEIKEILNLQAGRHTPYSREEIIIDHINLEQFQGTYTKVLVLMAPREVVRKRIDIIENAGMRVSDVRLSCEGFMHRLNRDVLASNDAIPVSCLNVDNAATDFCIFNKDGFKFVRSIPIGRNELTSGEEDSKRKFIDEIKKSFEVYQSDDIAKKPLDMFIIGPNEKIAAIAEELEGELNVKVHFNEIGDIFNFSDKAGEIIKDNPDDSCADLIFSAAESRNLTIDLMLEEVKVRRVFENKSRKMILAGILTMILFVEICSVFFSKVFFKEKYYDNLSESFAEVISEAEMINEISEKTRELKKFLSTRGTQLMVVDKLLSVLPDRLFLKKFKMEFDGSIVISGTSPAMSGIFSFAAALEDHRIFKDVNVDQTKSQKKGGVEVAEFQISMKLEQDGR